MTEDNWKLLVENGVLARYEREFRVEIEGRKMSTDDKQLIVRGHEKAVNEVIRLLQQPVDEAQLYDVSRKPTVTISEETWKLLDEHDALTGFRKGLKVDVTARRISTGQWELTLSGSKKAVDRLAGRLQHAPRKLELSDALSAWLFGQGPEGPRVYVISKRASVTIQISPDYRSALLIGSPSEIDVAVAMINGAHCATRRISRVVRVWLCAKRTGSNVARSLDLDVCDIRSAALMAYVKKKFDTTISMGPLSEGDGTQMVDLTVIAECKENLEGVFAHLDGIHKEYFEIDRATANWLINKRKGVEDARARELDVEFDSLIEILSDPREAISDSVGVEILGENADKVRDYRRMIDGVHCATRRISQLLGKWLCHKGKGSNVARSLDLDKKFDTTMSIGPYNEDDRTQMLDLTVVAEREENTEPVFAQLDGLHKEYFEIETVVAHWLTNKRKGAEESRVKELDEEFDSFLDFTSDPAMQLSDTIGVEILGEDAVAVRDYRRMIEATVVEKVNATQLHFEFWFGHDGDQARNRPHHRLEDSTDTKISRDDEAGLFHVAGRPQGVNEAVERINKTRHIKLFASTISHAMGKYIAAIRHDFEKDNALQIHLAYDFDGMRPGSVELRRLHRMNSEKDDDQAFSADNDLMHKLGLHEIVLEVPLWTKSMMKECAKLQKTTATGTGISKDEIKGRVLVHIAGSESSVRRCMEEVIARITNHPKYKEGAICLRRISEQSVVTAGFKKTLDAKPVNLSRCKEPFCWERLTRERWCYVGEPSGGRRPKALR